MQHFTYDFSPVFALIQGWIDKGYYPNGASISIARNGRVISSKSYGSHTPDTVEYIASSGKWLAASAIMVAVDEGDLSLDDPASKFIPELGPEKGAATLRQLLAHTSGYPAYQPIENPPDQYQTLEEAVAQIVPLALDAPPGTKWNYGGLSLQVAGRMAEIATRKDWETFFQEKLAHPLGMDSTRFTPVDAGFGHSPMLGGGARSTLRDYGHFLSMFYNEGVYDGHRFLTEQSIEDIQADQVRDAEITADNFVTARRQAAHKGIYGLGSWRESQHADGHALMVSSPSWAGAYPWLDKKRHVYAMFMAHVDVEAANRDGFNAMHASMELAGLVGTAIDTAKPAPKRIKSAPVAPVLEETQEPPTPEVATAPDTPAEASAEASS